MVSYFKGGIQATKNICRHLKTKLHKIIILPIVAANVVSSILREGHRLKMFIEI